MMRHSLKIATLLLGWLVLGTLAQAQEAPPLNDRLLVWVGAGSDPERFTREAPGVLAYLHFDGTLETLMVVPARTERVVPCGDSGRTPDGRTVFFYVGAETEGVLYKLTSEMSEPVIFNAAVNAMACVGNGTAQFSADSAYFAYLNYNANYRFSNAPIGRLLIQSVADASIVGNFENAAAFEMNAQGASVLSFYFDSRGEAVEAAVLLWDGENQREVATLFADHNNRCAYQTGSIAALPDGRQAVLLGLRCERGNVRDPQWQLHLIDPQTRSASQLLSGRAAGSYFPFARTNQIFAAPDGRSIFFVVPDGLTNRSTSLLQSDLNNPAANTIIERSALTASVSALPFASGGHPLRRSRDGRWLAAVVSDPNGNTTLQAIDLNAPELLPIVLSAGARGDTISETTFAQSSERLFYVAGGLGGANNSLWVLDLVTGTEMRLNRGRYEQGVISPDGDYLLMINYAVLAEREPPYLTLTVVNTTSGAEALLFVGGEIVEGRLTNPRFAYPLAWLRGDS